MPVFLELPSPKSNSYEYGEVPPLAKPVKVTKRGACPEVGLLKKETDTGEGGGVNTRFADIVKVFCCVLLRLSVTERVAVNNPSVPYS